MSETELSVVEQSGSVLPFVAPSAKDTELAKKYSGQGSFLPILTFATGMSKLLKDKSKPVEPEHYVLKSGKDITDIGSTVVIIPVATRFTATSNDPSFHAVYDESSPVAADYMAKSKVQPTNRTHYFGYDVLVWLPNVNDGIFAILPFTNATARNTYADIYKNETTHRLGKTCLMGNQFIESNGNEYFAMSVKPYSGAPEVVYSMDDLKVAMLKFPQKGEAKKASDDQEGVETTDGPKTARG